MHTSDNGPALDPDSFIDRLRRENTEPLDDNGDTTAVTPKAADAAVDPAGLSSSDEDRQGCNQQGDDHEKKPARRLPPEARRVLISLMRQGVVLAARKAKVFEALVRHEGAIRGAGRG